MASIPEAVASLKACGSLQSARKIHASAAQQGDALNVFVANTIVATYARFGAVDDARRFLLQGMGVAGVVDIVSWNSIIGGCASSGHGEIGLEMFVAMQERGFVPNARTLVAALKACCVCAERKKKERESLRQSSKLELMEILEIARNLEDLAVKLRYESDIYVANTLIDTFVKCESLDDARRVFEGMNNRSVVSWTALMMGYAQSGGGGDIALELFLRMESSGFKPNSRTYIAALKACMELAGKQEEEDDPGGGGVKMRSLERGMSLHSQLAGDGYEGHVFLASTLVDFYAKCGSIVDAEMAFWRARNRDLVLWNAMAMAYAQCGRGELGLELFQTMDQREKLAGVWVSSRPRGSSSSDRWR